MKLSKPILQSSALRDLLRIAIGAAFLAFCSWFSIPFPIPFTLQLFCVYLLNFLFGGRKALLSVSIYLLLGALGVPVFSGFQGGIGHLIGPLGGFLIGMLLICLVCCFKGLKPWVLAAIGTLLCYALGAVWFFLLGQSETTFGAILFSMVLPFLPLDALKLYLSHLVSKRLLPRLEEGGFHAAKE